MKKSVLIVEDNIALANVYRATLSMSGFAVQVTATGSAAIAAIDKQLPDAIILDLVLPDMDGLSILTALRAAGGARASLPVIVFSNTYSGERLQQVWDAGATQVLAKASSSPKQVVAAVRAAVDGEGGQA